jgi:hypothetical protein
MGKSLRLFGFAALVAAWVPVSARAEVVGRCATAAGDLEIQRGTVVEWAAAASDEQLRAGDGLRSRGRGAATLELGGHVAIRLSGQVELRVSAPTELQKSQGAQGLVILGAGAAWATLENADKSKEARALAVQVGPISAVLRGTSDEPAQVRLSLAGKDLDVAVLAGSVKALGPAKAEAVAKAGERLGMSAKGFVAAAPLPAGPAALSPSADERFFCPGLLLRLSWSALDGADLYSLQVSRDAAFASGLDLSAEVARPAGVFVPREPGRYHWRVAARVGGRWTNFSEPSAFACEAGAVEDKLLSPGNNASATFPGKAPRLVFSWKPVPGAARYKFVLAKGTELTGEAAAVKVTEKTSADVAGLEPGEYRWGVFVDGDAPQPLHAAPRRLVLTKGKAAGKLGDN